MDNNTGTSRYISAGRVNIEQRQIMLSFMKEHPAAASGRLCAPDGAKYKERLLKELADLLNCVASGATKTPDKWLKSWQDWRSDVKQKAAKIRRHACGIGGGPMLKQQLTELEEELLAFIGYMVVNGDALIVDPVDARFASSRSHQQETFVAPPNASVTAPPMSSPPGSSPPMPSPPSPSPSVIIFDDLPTSRSAVPSSTLTNSGAQQDSICIAVPRVGSTISPPSPSTSEAQQDNTLFFVPPAASPSSGSNFSYTSSCSQENTRKRHRTASNDDHKLGSDRLLEATEARAEAARQALCFEEEKHKAQLRQWEMEYALRERSVAAQEAESSLRERSVVAQESACQAVVLAMQAFMEYLRTK